jgi:hypothetical protein
MDASPNLTTPLEVPPDTIEIRAENAISIPEALAIAENEGLDIGHSTLQRWAKVWRLKGAASPVKSLLSDTRFGKEYRLDRDDFTTWVLKEKENEGPREVPRDPARPDETSQDAARSRETSRDLNEAARVKELEDQIFQLRIDLAARNQLIEMARGDMSELKEKVYELNREVGALNYQLLQLGSAKAETKTVTSDVDNRQQ